MPHRDRRRRPPEISVIIPTFNRLGTLEECLRALGNQSVSNDAMEIVVVDDGSTQKGYAGLAAELGRMFTHSKYIRIANSGPSRARNVGIREAGAKLALFINDDTIALQGLIAEHLTVHARHPASGDAVLGRVKVHPSLPPSALAQYHLDAAYDRLEGNRTQDWRAFFTCNISVKTDFLRKNGMFDERLRNLEDVELGERLSHSGLRILYHPRALGYHDHYFGEREYLDFASRYGRALVAWYRKTPRLKRDLLHFGYYPSASAPRRLKYLVGDILVNRGTRPLLIAAARRFMKYNERISLLLYQKIYASISRETIRHELRLEQR